jgi:Ni/Fe-hydrogenase subunit HybB-like protein/CBS domain-containing protein
MKTEAESLQRPSILSEKFFALLRFSQGLLYIAFRGGKGFYAWMAFLTGLIGIGGFAYLTQWQEGLYVTNMRDQVSWGFYIANFTFLVGIAAAAVLLIIPAYLYSFKAIKKIAVFGELLAVSAITTALLFIAADFGRPERFWHALPWIGSPNFPGSVLAWDMIVLNGYLFLNLMIALSIGYYRYHGREPRKWLVLPLIMLSIPWAVGVHTVTAFVYNGLAARPFWNASILAPRFLASAFCSGPALMIIIFQILRKVTDFRIEDKAITKLAEIVAYAMAINLFLLGAEIFKEYYSATHHLAPLKYLYQGLHGHNNLVPWIWSATALNITGFLLFLIPKTRKNLIALNIGCIALFAGIWIEKGMGLIIPGFIPDSLGEIYEYMPSGYELMISGGIWAAGAMLFTFLSRVAIAVDSGRLRHPDAPPLVHEEEGVRARDIMTTEVITVSPLTSVDEVSRLLIANRISGIPVVEESGRVVGVVSESDIIFREIHDQPHLVEKLGDMVLPRTLRSSERSGGTAGDIMTSPPLTAVANSPLGELIRIFTEKRIKRVVIVDDEMRIAGIVSRIDIVKALERPE